MVLQVRLPGNHNTCASPQHSAKSSTDRRDVCKLTRRSLNVTHSIEMSFQELIGIGNIGSGRGEHADIARPSHTFISLWTIRRYGKEVINIRPYQIRP